VRGTGGGRRGAGVTRQGFARGSEDDPCEQRRISVREGGRRRGKGGIENASCSDKRRKGDVPVVVQVKA
jgi:hypothetical protein